MNPKVTWCTSEVSIDGMNNFDIVQGKVGNTPKVSIAAVNFVASPTAKNNQAEVCKTFLGSGLGLKSSGDRLGCAFFTP